MAALGLICVLASGSCWAQQSTSSTTDKPKAQAKAAPAKPAAKKKPEAKTAKASKDTKAAKPVASDQTWVCMSMTGTLGRGTAEMIRAWPGRVKATSGRTRRST